MRQSAYCKPFLETILNIRIDHIEYPKTQESIDLDVRAKSVRLDVYVDDGKNTVYYNIFLISRLYLKAML